MAINFVLPPGSVRVLHLHMIKIWALVNPKVKIYIYLDSFADQVAMYFQLVNEYLRHNPDDKSDEKFNEKMEFFKNNFISRKRKYLEILGGETLMKDFIEEYLDKLREAVSECKSKTIKDALEETMSEIRKKLMGTMTERVDIKTHFNRENQAILSGESVDNLSFIDEFAFADLPENIRNNISVRDFYVYASKYDKKLCSLYHFEMLCNRDPVLQQNLFMCMIASRDAGITMSVTNYPKFNLDFPSKKIEEALSCAFLKLEGINVNVYHAHADVWNKINATDRGSLFAPLQSLRQDAMYLSFNESEGAINYMSSVRDADRIINAIYAKRSKQIQMHLLSTIKVTVGDLVDKDLKVLHPIEAKRFLKIQQRVEQKILTFYRTDNAEISRQMAAASSNYKTHVSECTGSKFWKAMNYPPNPLRSIENPIKFTPFNPSAEEYFVNVIQDRTMDPDIDLNIFVYVHSGVEYLSHSRYPHFSRQGMLFVYDGKSANSRIEFRESGITRRKNQILTEVDVRNYVQSIAQKNGKIRIHIVGHSAPNFKTNADNPNNPIKVEQSVGDLTINEFNRVFMQFINEYLGRSSIHQILFVSCNLATLIENRKKSLESLPNGTFLAKFIDHILSKGITLRQVKAADARISVAPFEGQITLSQKDKNFEIRLYEIDCNTKLTNSGEYKWIATEFTTDVTLKGHAASGPTFGISDDVFASSSAIEYPEVLEVPAAAERISNDIVAANRARRHGHFMLESDVTALVGCAQFRNGNFVIVSPVPEKISALRLAFRMALEFNDFVTWKAFLYAVFPNAIEHIKLFLTEENFKQLLRNILSSKILFVNVDLSRPLACVNIRSYLAISTGNDSVAVINVSNQENDISRISFVEEAERYTADANDFAVERQQISERRDTAFKNLKDNINALNEHGDALVIYSNKESSVQTSDWSSVRDEWNIHSDIVRNDLVSREATHAKTFSETYHMAKELREATAEIFRSTPATVEAQNLVPLLDTLTSEGEGEDQIWSLTFIDPLSEEHIAITIQTKKSIFQRVSNFIKRVAMEHIATTGSAALNLYFAVEALCHWIENGFRPSTEGISDKHLATAMEVHFYINATGALQGIVEPGVSAIKISTQISMKNALLIAKLKPYVKAALLMAKISRTGKVLLQLGRFASKGMVVIGLLVSLADFGLNIFELAQNRDPTLRPTLITNTVFSTVGLILSIAAIVAVIVGATAWTGPLALVGVGVAFLAIPVSYLVKQFTDAVERAKHVGRTIEAIVSEIEQGTYKKDEENKTLCAPYYVAVKELKLTAAALEIAYGKFYYREKSKSNCLFTNLLLPGIEYDPNDETEPSFTKWFHAKREFFVDENHVRIPIDNNYRIILMPHVAGYTFHMDLDVLPAGASRGDAEFDKAREIQSKDPEFQFQEGGLAVFDKIADNFSFDYEPTDINIHIAESNWNMVFPWGDPAHAENDDEKKTINDTNEQFRRNLNRITYHISASCGGRQYISLPGLDCPLNVRLDATNNDAQWFIQFTERTISENELEIAGDHIKLGALQKIQLNGQKSAIYVVLSKYHCPDSDYIGIAYYDVRKNVFFYNKEADPEEQEQAQFLFDTKEYACFYLHKDDETLWFVCNETKKLLLKFNGVKTFQNQGDGTVVISKEGVIYFIAKDPTKDQMLSQTIFGFTEEWFGKEKKPIEALAEINTLLEANAYNPVIHLYLPHRTNDGKMIKTHTCFVPEKERYFVLDEVHADARFVSCDDERGYFVDEKQKQLITTEALNTAQMAKRIMIFSLKRHIHMTETCPVLMRGVLNAFPATKGLSVAITNGLEFLLYKDDSSKYQINVQMFHLDDVNADADFGDRLLNNNSLLESQIRNEHLGDSNLIKEATIKRSFLVAIEHAGKCIGYSMDGVVGYICTAQFPNAYTVRTLGHDDSHVYHIIDGQTIYQSDWIEHLAQIRDGPKTSSTSLCKADVIELFDQTMFVNSLEIDESSDLWKGLEIVSKLLEIEFIWMDSSRYKFEFGRLTNVTYSMDLTDIAWDAVKIQCYTSNHPDMRVQRMNFDLCFTCPSTKSALVLPGVFKENVGSNVKIVVEFLDGNVATLISIYNEAIEHTGPISILDRPFYPSVTMEEILNIWKEHLIKQMIEN